ncbi:PAS domain S-box protein [Algoriphagus sp. A40]|uniref:PAS domain S-box protein n=1 Tax=Algoriphagus sp. A40 TaxID=1945863 RepID=UPI0009841812|nr:PAS domain S-box protein [Algoriphagus sp. A40]OOG75304.1 hypothetical protein B0E43_09990 [Algoriphagus sp. A40]
MLNKITSAIRLYFLVFLLSGAILGIGIYGIYQLNVMNENTKTLYADRVVPIEQLAAIRHSYIYDILFRFVDLENRTNEPDLLLREIEETQQVIEKSWESYKKTYLTPEEVELVTQTELLKENVDSAISTIKQRIRNDNQVEDLVDEAQRAAFNAITGKLNELIDLQVGISTQVSKGNEQLYRDTTKKFILFIVIALLSALGLAYILLKGIWELILNLEGSNRLLKSSEAKYRAFIENAGDSIFILDNELNISEVNESACNLLGYTREELKQTKYSVINPTWNTETNSEGFLAQSLDEGKVYQSQLKRKNGTLVEIEVNIKVLENVGFISIARDTTERRKVELAIKQSEEKYRDLFNKTPAFITIWDIESFTILEVNNTVIEKFGYTLQEWEGMSVLQYRPPEEHDQVKESARLLLNEGQPVFHEMGTQIKRNSETMQVEISSHKIIYKNRPAVLSHARDVTEQKKAEEELRKSEVQFRSLIDHAADAIFMVTDWGMIFDVNQSASTLFQYSRDELIGMSVLDLYPEQIRSTVPIIIWDPLKQSNIYINETVLYRKDGQGVHVEISRKMLPDATGTIAIVRDITERFKAEEKLRQSEEKYRSLTENITDAIVLTDADNVTIYRSPATERITGYTDEEAQNINLLDLVHPDDKAHSVEGYLKAMNEPGVPDHFKVRIRHKKGHFVWIEGTTLNMFHNESIKALVTNFRDITLRKQVEEQLALSALIVNSTDDAIISKTVEGEITSWNHGAEKVLGYTAEEAIGQSIYMLIAPELFEEEVMISENIKQGKSVDHYETRRIRKDGRVINVSLTISPIMGESGQVIGASKIMRDITEQKTMELERDKIMDELIQRNRDLEQFSYIVSHNLRAPVANIISISDFMLRPSLNPAKKEQLGEGLAKSVLALDGVIKDLNQILQSKREVSEHTSSVNFSELLHAIKLSIANLVEENRVHFIIDFAEVDEMVTLKSYLYSIFYNLITNSIKYRQPHIDPIIEIASKLTDSGIEIKFKDNGLGIDLQKKGEQVFGLYKRFHSHTEGKGMGLYMVKTQVETLGGKISIESEVSIGTTFKIEFGKPGK